MGGNAIKSAQRMNRETFDQYWSELRTLFPELLMVRPPCYRQKSDFGDLDIVVQTNPSLNIKELVRERVIPLEEYDNGPFYSFLYKEIQVDFIFHSPEDFAIATEYYSYNDVCNFIGRVARSLNFKFGHDGLFYEEHLDDHYKISIFVSNDIEKILPFLGYSYERWTQGFDTIEEILEYGASSTFFNALYFDLAEQNNVDRVRNKKRKMYQNMLKYIEEHGLQPKPKLDASERWTQAMRAQFHFNNMFLFEVQHKRDEYKKLVRFKSMFNGNVVRELTGLDGKELGQFMSEIRQEEGDFQQMVLLYGDEHVKQVVLKKFNKERPQKELMQKIEMVKAP